MDDKRVRSKTELLQHMDTAWQTLSSVLDSLSDEHQSKAKDEAGWGVADHLTHLAAWTWSVVYFLQGKPRHEGLGVDESTYLSGDDDTINAQIQNHRSHASFSEARKELHDVYMTLKGLIEPLTDSDLLEPYQVYLPNEPGEGNGRIAIDVVYGNTAYHFVEHTRWIEAFVEGRLDS